MHLQRSTFTFKSHDKLYSLDANAVYILWYTLLSLSLEHFTPVHVYSQRLRGLVDCYDNDDSSFPCLSSMVLKKGGSYCFLGRGTNINESHCK